MVFEQKELKILMLAFFTLLFIGIIGTINNITGNPVLSIQEESVDVLQEKCADGTLINECSPTKPLFCNPQLQLVRRCDLCGCSSGSCQSDGYCKEEKTSLCISSQEICDGKDNDCDGGVDEEGVCSTNTVSSFQQVYGKEWKIETDKNNIPIKLSGGNIPTEQITGKREKITKENINIISKTFIDKNKDLLKVDSSDLKPSKVFSSPKSKVRIIRYKQEYSNIPVYDSYTTLAYSGDALTFYKTNYDSSIKVNTIPKITKEKTLENIKRDLSALRSVDGIYSALSNPGFSTLDSGIPGRNQPDSWIKETKDDDLRTIKLKSVNANYVKNLNPEKSELIIFPLNIVKGNGYKLAWKIDLPLNTEEGEKWTYFVDAETGGVIYKFDNIVYATVSGNVKGKIYPETPTDGFEIKPFNHERIIFSSSPDAYTTNGSYVIDTTETGGRVVANLEGLYVYVNNYQQSNAHFQSGIVNPPATQDIDWFIVDSSYKQEESNVFYHANIVHDFFTKGGSFDMYSMDFPMWANIEISDICNAYADGSSINFFMAGEASGWGFCEATSLGSDIIYHEYTHNVHFAIYEGINMPYYGQTGGMMEGWADYFASTITNDPVMGENIFPEPIRYLNNSLRYPEDYNEEPHAASEVFSPALWEIRQSIGAEPADALVLNAMKLTPMSFSEFVEAMLIADDDNGNLDDGTLHINDICHAFWDNHGIASSFCAGYTQTPLAFLEGNLSYKGRIEIKGIATPSQGSSLVNYILDYQSIGGPWSQVGIELVNNGGVPVNWGVLGYLNTDLASEGGKNLRLTVYDSSGQSSSYQVPFVIDRHIKSGFPVKVPYNYGGQIISAPTVDDLDGNRTKEIVLMGDHNIYVYDSTGNLKWSKPMAGWSFYGGLSKVVTIGDLNNDNKKEVFVSWFQRPGEVDDEGNLANYCLYGWKYDGTPLEGFPAKCLESGYEWDPWLAPRIVDLNNDGQMEIIATFVTRMTEPFKNKIYAFDNKGGILPNWPIEFNSPDANNGDIVVADLNGDKTLEIIWKFFSLGENTPYYILNYNGTIINTFYDDQIYPDISINGLAAADIDNDGKSEFAKRYNAVTSVFESNGTLLWSDISRGFNDGYISFGDVTGDKNPEIILGDMSPLYRGRTYIYNSLTGAIIKFWEIDPDSQSTPDKVNRFENMIADINNDGKNDIIATVWEYENWQGYDYIYAWNSDGSIIDGFPKYISGGSLSPPILEDIDNDGKYEIILTNLNMELFVWDTDGNVNPNKKDWTQLNHDAQHTGLYGYEPFICADLNHDGVRDILDVTLLVNAAFRNGAQPEPKWIGDLNGDNFIDILDVVHMINHAFRNGPVPTCTSQPLTTSSSGTISLGGVSGTTTKTVPVNLETTESSAGTTFKISYDTLKANLKNVRLATRTTGMDLIRNGNTITLIKQDGSKTISKGTGAIAYLDFVTGKSGFDTSSLKITEVKAANPEAKKISVSIGESTSVKSGITLS